MDNDEIKNFNDLPSVDPVDTDEVLCGRGRIAFSALMSLMQGDIEAATEAVEELKSDTESIYDLTETAYSEIMGAKTDVETAKSDVEAIQEDIEETQTEINTTKQEVADLADAATQVVGLQALSQITQKKGELYFPNYTCAYSPEYLEGDFSTYTVAFNLKNLNEENVQFWLPFSLTCTSEANTTVLNFLNISTQYSSLSTVSRYTVDGTTYDVSKEFSSYLSTLMDGNYHSVVVVFRGTKENNNSTYSIDADLYIDGELCTLSSFTSKAEAMPAITSAKLYLNQSYTVYNSTAVCANRTNISDFKIFNFELPVNEEADTDGVGYTVQDFYNGLDVPFSLQLTSAEKRCIYDVENYTYTVGSTQYVPASIGSNLTCSTGTSASHSPIGTHDNKIKTLSDLIISNT